MKKTILFILPFVLLTAGILFSYNYYLGGKDYYTRVGEPVKVTTGKFPNSEKYIEYTYTHTAFNK